MLKFGKYFKKERKNCYILLAVFFRILRLILLNFIDINKIIFVLI